jgi:hypothetical protein
MVVGDLHLIEGRSKSRKKNYSDQREQFGQASERMTRPGLVRKIEQGKYGGYHVRVIKGIKTPVSNTDRSENNNLG